MRWRRITEFEDYEVSDTGEVRSFKWGKCRLLTNTENECGYLSVKLGNRRRLVHRLVALAFILNPKMKPDVNHKDGNKKNNSAANLEWVTKNENIQHSIKAGLHANPSMPIHCIELDRVFVSQADAARHLNIKQANISRVVNGARRKAGGFTFRRVN